MSTQSPGAKFKNTIFLGKIDKTKEITEVKKAFARRNRSVFVSGSTNNNGSQKADTFDQVRGLKSEQGSYNNLQTYLPTSYEKPRLEIL